jgi:hypothetical protein
MSYPSVRELFRPLSRRRYYRGGPKPSPSYYAADLRVCPLVSLISTKP